MKLSRVVIFATLGVASQFSHGATSPVSCLTLLEGWATAANLLKVPVGAPATRANFFKYLGEAGIPVTVYYTDKTGGDSVTGAIEFGTQDLTSNISKQVMSTQVKLTPHGPQAVQFPSTILVPTTTKSEVVQVTTGPGATHVPLADVTSIQISPGVRLAMGINKLSVLKLHVDLLGRGATIGPRIKVASSADAESVLVKYARGGRTFSLTYFTTATKLGDPMARKVQVVLFPTEADRLAFDTYLGGDGSFYSKYFTDF